MKKLYVHKSTIVYPNFIFLLNAHWLKFQHLCSVYVIMLSIPCTEICAKNNCFECISEVKFQSIIQNVVKT